MENGTKIEIDDKTKALELQIDSNRMLLSANIRLEDKLKEVTEAKDDMKGLNDRLYARLERTDATIEGQKVELETLKERVPTLQANFDKYRHKYNNSSIEESHQLLRKAGLGADVPVLTKIRILIDDRDKNANNAEVNRLKASRNNAQKLKYMALTRKHMTNNAEFNFIYGAYEDWLKKQTK